jgi:hypothetical protein
MSQREEGGGVFFPILEHPNGLNLVLYLKNREKKQKGSSLATSRVVF